MPTLHEVDEETRMIALRDNRRTYKTFIPCDYTYPHTNNRFTDTTHCVTCYAMAQRQLQYTRDEVAIMKAQLHDKRTYKTAVTCPQGHRGSRFTDSHDCFECWATTPKR